MVLLCPFCQIFRKGYDPAKSSKNFFFLNNMLVNQCSILHNNSLCKYAQFIIFYVCLSAFQFGAIKMSPYMNILMHVIVQKIFWSVYPKVVLLIQKIHLFNFIRQCQIVFQISALIETLSSNNKKSIASTILVIFTCLNACQ